jgi:hypothetical protein
MHSRLIFLHPMRRSDSVRDVFSKHILRLVVEVPQRESVGVEADLLLKCAAKEPRKAGWIRSIGPY